MRVNVLGPLEVIHEGRVIDIPGEKLRTIVAVLSLELNRPVSKDELVRELWPDGQPRNSLNSLHGHVARLRRILVAQTGQPGTRQIVQTLPAGYRLALSRQDVDVQRFRDRLARAATVPPDDAWGVCTLLSEALALWQGPALLDTGQGPICRMAYTNLEETRLNAVEQLLRYKLELGQHDRIIAELEQYQAQHPLRERLAELLMTALYRSGRQAEALDVYQRTRQLLVRDLGLEPGDGLSRVLQTVLRQQAGAEPVGRRR
jgi:DNA-binding SARP family transcriptional activator